LSQEALETLESKTHKFWGTTKGFQKEIVLFTLEIFLIVLTIIEIDSSIFPFSIISINFLFYKVIQQIIKTIQTCSSASGCLKSNFIKLKAEDFVDFTTNEIFI